METKFYGSSVFHKVAGFNQDKQICSDVGMVPGTIFQHLQILFYERRKQTGVKLLFKKFVRVYVIGEDDEPDLASSD